MTKILPAFIFTLSQIAFSQPVQAGTGPRPAAPTPQIEAPRDRIFHGVMKLDVDASDTVHKIIRVRQSIPVQKSGDMVLLYPEWETASHAATQTVADLAGLSIMAGNTRLEWQRDTVNPYAFHITVPKNARELRLEFQILPASRGLSPDILKLQWSRLALYPAGWYLRNIASTASLTLPKGFQFATSLDSDAVNGNQISFKQTSVEKLMDAPVYAGRYFKRVELTATGAVVPIRLNMVGDTEAAIAITPEFLAKYQAMVLAVPKLFKGQPYPHFDFLVTLSDTVFSGGGAEHSESTEINLPADFFTNADAQLRIASLHPHEYTHAWNGRFRQPADLWTPNLNLPMRGSLLWMYEGQAEFWGRILTSHLGFMTRQQSLEALAMDAAFVSARVGRQWKSLQDSTIDPIYMAGGKAAVRWRDWQRREDYYVEGVMLWLDVEMLMRERSSGKTGLVDFAGKFFGGGKATSAISTYTFADICKGLNKLVPYDWAAYFTTRLQAHDASHVLDGLTRSGYLLIYTDEPTDYFTKMEADTGATDFSHSLGLIVNGKGVVNSVTWEGPAFQAGISLGTRLLNVGKEVYSDVALKQAIKAAAVSKEAIALTFMADGKPRTVSINYTDSLRYPRLERIPGTIDRLDGLLSLPVYVGG
ncbi:peptidase M61 [Undibacterium sp. TJN19]|uniref:M61 family metallopeptidase n=1 Tax=Undibacterium sp. TJN19 TaxID=3413055 RepID=UPI003BF36F65